MLENEQESILPPSVQNEYDDPWNKLHIDLGALRSNYNYLRSLLNPGTVFYAVLKSDAYGHGIVEAGKTLAESGCMHFAVESPHEGVKLRNEGIAGEILLMNPIPLWMAELAVRHDLSVSVIHHSILKPLDEAAKLMGKTCKVHLQANVGLNRMGIPSLKVMKTARMVCEKEHLEFEGLYGQPRNSSSALESLEKLRNLYQKLVSEDIAPNYIHFANSINFLSHPEVLSEGVRLGILLYGIMPDEQYKDKDLKPVMSLKTEIVQIDHIKKGSKIGYHTKKKTEHDMIIGTIPVGYYHGFNRNMVNNGYVLVNEKKAPFVGEISMNSSTIDISNIAGISIGEQVTIIGNHGNERITFNDLAANSGTISAELMMNFGKSIARRYKIDENDVMDEVVFENKIEGKIHIKYFQSENEFPDRINVFDIINFLQVHLIPYDDPKETIITAVEYALSLRPNGKGFILLATRENTILGCVVCIQMEKMEVIPENLFVYVCVHKSHRNKGIGSRLIEEAINCVDGDIKLHVEKTNPAIKLYKKIGFKDNYYEMRFSKRR